jgi:hypothetical protein
MRSVDLSFGFGAYGKSPPNKRLNPTAVSDRDRPQVRRGRWADNNQQMVIGEDLDCV